MYTKHRHPRMLAGRPAPFGRRWEDPRKLEKLKRERPKNMEIIPQ